MILGTFLLKNHKLCKQKLKIVEHQTHEKVLYFDQKNTDLVEIGQDRKAKTQHPL